MIKQKGRFGAFVLVAVLSWFGCHSPTNSTSSSQQTHTGSANKVNLQRYIDDIYGVKVLSGQMNLTWDQSIDMVARVYTDTGKYPAIQGFDFMNYTDKNGAHSNANNQTSLAQAWWTNAKSTGKHGIVTFCWHWRDPSEVTDNFYANNANTISNKGSGSVVDSSVSIPLNGSNFDPTTALGIKIKADLDTIAAELKTLQNAGVPVLWRPLHEGGGNGSNSASSGPNAWFWWGQNGSTAYKALYIYMYNYFTTTKGLDNLIWVWNGQDSSYYPGDAYVDITGWDIYSQGDTGSQIVTHNSLKSISSAKPTALTEVGTMPSPANFASYLNTAGKYFAWFMVWNDGNGSVASSNFWSGNFSSTDNSTNYPWNGKAFRSTVYNHTSVVTLDELPDLTAY